MSPKKIQDELLRWVDEKMATIKNEIFTMKGTGSDLASVVSGSSADVLARV